MLECAQKNKIMTKETELSMLKGLISMVENDFNEKSRVRKKGKSEDLRIKGEILNRKKLLQDLSDRLEFAIKDEPKTKPVKKKYHFPDELTRYPGYFNGTVYRDVAVNCSKAVNFKLDGFSKVTLGLAEEGSEYKQDYREKLVLKVRTVLEIESLRGIPVKTYFIGDDGILSISMVNYDGDLMRRGHLYNKELDYSGDCFEEAKGFVDLSLDHLSKLKSV